MTIIMPDEENFLKNSTNNYSSFLLLTENNLENFENDLDKM